MTTKKNNGLAVAASICLGLLPMQAFATPNILVKLVASDGTVSLQGQLMSVEEGYYVIQTSGQNEVRVQSHLIECVSAICPE